ncbi:MAG: hypothetical protein M1826_004966 [Phylliscum demangeonii]|nr:MAG: hypothetical protein M1826_004966 [Phylliscum demangeonii]
MADSEISLMWEEAVSQYNETTGANLLDAGFPKPQSAVDLLSLVDERQSKFSKFRSKRGKILAVLKVALKPVQLLGKLAADGASLAFRPSSAIFGAVIYLIDVAKDVSANYDTIIKLFAAVKGFTCRLRVHEQEKIPPELQKIVTEILISLMSICAISTKSIKRGRFLKYTKAFFLGRDPAVQDALDRLKSLTENENIMVGALILAQTGKTGKVVDNVHLNVVDTNATVKDMHEQRSSSADKVARFSQTYIIVDALDECSNCDGILDVIEEIVGWKTSSLHLLVTSRKEKKIEERFQALQPVLIPLRRSQVEGDIRRHVHHSLLTTAELKIWPERIQLEMEDALVNGAQGM